MDFSNDVYSDRNAKIREAAVYALYDYGIRCVIAPSFGDIHYQNAIRNGLLPALVSEADAAELAAAIAAQPDQPLTVNLERQTIACGSCCIRLQTRRCEAACGQLTPSPVVRTIVAKDGEPGRCLELSREDTMRAMCWFPPVAATLLLAQPGLANAAYPDRPVHMIVSVAAGGGVDVMARLLAQRLSERLHQPFVVENRPGAGGIIGSKAVIAASPDGYTLLYTPSSLSLTLVVHKNPPYDLKKDFTPIINVAISPYVLVVNPSLPVHSFKEFVAYAKQHPGEITYSSAGVGTASHLAGELLKEMAGIDILHVPNKSMNPALLDVMGGQVNAMFASVPAIKKESIRIRPVAMAEKRRSALLPDLPTIEQSGLPGFEVANWAGLLGPPGLDPQIVKKLHDEVVAILATPDMKERAEKLGYDLIESTPDEFAAQLQADVERWGGVAKKAGLSVQ